MPRPRAPVPPDPERLARMLETAREARRAAARAAARSLEPPEAPAAQGWVPQSAPSGVDIGWLDDPWGLTATRSSGSDGPGRGGEPGGDRGGGVGERLRATDPSAGEGLPPGRHRRGPRVLTVPTPFRGARIRVTWRAVVALLVVVLVSGGVFAVRVAQAQQTGAPQVVPASGGLVGRTAAPTAFGSVSGSVSGSVNGSVNASGPGSPTNRQLVVDVIGQVVRPGVVSVPEGSRVTDVLAAVGGALPGADVQRLNLARLVSDGEQLFVPRPGETPPAPLSGGGAAGAPAGSASSASGGVVDLNTATLAALDGLPGVGPVLAQRILDWRTEHGRFSSVDELGEVSGIGDKLLGQIRAKVRV